MPGWRAGGGVKQSEPNGYFRSRWITLEQNKTKMHRKIVYHVHTAYATQNNPHLNK
jgi:hypothetical protein